MTFTKLIFVTSLLALMTACATTQDNDLPASGDIIPPPPVSAEQLKAEEAAAITAQEMNFTAMPAIPLDHSQTLTRIAIGSCYKQTEPGDEIWDKIAATNPNLFLYIGDNVYGDVWEDDYQLPELRTAYETLAANEKFAAFRRSTPLMVTWDDHDYGRNDAGANFPMKLESEKLFENVWAVPEDDIRRHRPGVYFTDIIGQEEGRKVQIIMLDTRFFRDDLKPTDEKGAPGKERYMPDYLTSKTMLGADQWAWLQSELEKPADLRLLVSSIQVIADGHGWEAWRTLPNERQKLYDTIKAAGAESLVLISGDRHAGAIYRRDEKLAYPLYELTASSLNLPASKWRAENGETRMEPGPYRLTDMFYDVNFGQVDIDWDKDEIYLRLIDQNGAVAQEQRIKMDELRPVY